MPDKPFVINDRRRFTAEGELRPDAPPAEQKPPRDDSPIESSASHAVEAGSSKDAGPRLVTSEPLAPDTPETPEAPIAAEADEAAYPPPPTAEQTEQAARAYDATVERLDTAIRAQNLGADHIPPMSFERLVQSLYMQAILQLGGTAAPGQQPQLDLLGARQTIDMLAIIGDKSKGNLSDSEQKLIDSALFEMHMAFLEITQAVARQAAARQSDGPMPPPPGGGPSIVR